MSHSKGILAGILVLTSIMLLSSHHFYDEAFPQGSPTKQLDFALSASGLPDKGMWKCTPAIADLNKDSHLDIIAMPRLGKGAQVFLGNGKGEWVDSSHGLEMPSSCGGGVAVGDINKDGFQDLAVADHCSGVFVYLGDGRGRWNQIVKTLSPVLPQQGAPADPDEDPGTSVGAEDLALGDVNEDGFLDIVAGSSDRGGLTVFLGDGSGVSWKESPAEGLPSAKSPEPGDENEAGWANQVRLIDINKDGHLDVLAAYYKGPRVWLGDGKGHWKTSSQGLPEPTIGGLFRGIASGDVNEDGLSDLVVASEVNGPEVYLQMQDGSWKTTPDVFPQMKDGALAISLADLDGDGHLDLVVGGRPTTELGSIYGIFVLKGDGNGKWRQEEGTGLPSKGLSITWGIGLADLNEDGLPDIVASTGGVVAGESDLPPQMRSKLSKVAAAIAAVPPVPELQLPRMQVWLNQAKKSK